MINENILEMNALAYFEEMGYQCLSGIDVETERLGYDDVLLRQTLLESLINLNPNLPHNAIENALEVLNEFALTGNLIEQNQIFYQYLTQGVTVTYRGKNGDETDNVLLIDFENPANNIFKAIQQFTIQNGDYTRRADIIIYINGLPLAIFELKNPKDEHADIQKAYNQLQNYKAQITPLFIYNQIMVISDGMVSKYGSLTAPYGRYMYWRDETNAKFQSSPLKDICKGLFEPATLLDYIRNFILFSVDKNKKNKIIAAKHQYYGVKAAEQRIIDATQTNGDKKGGVFWHTQGSGKSYSMLFLAAKLMQDKELKNPTIIVVTDRKDLDDQLFKTFTNAKQRLNTTPQQIGSKNDLRSQLKDKPSGGVFFTTIHKFIEDDDLELCVNKRDNIIVLSDEAHRSQYGLTKKLDNKTGEYKLGVAGYMRKILPNATFIGFTGTPIAQADKNTRAIFGEDVHVYDFTDAINDGATVPIYYESRLVPLEIDKAKAEEIDDIFDYDYDSENEIYYNEKEKQRLTNLKQLIGADNRIEKVASDILRHFDERQKVNKGKAMIVCADRKICVKLYDAMIKIDPNLHHDDWDKGQLKIMMTGSASDEPHIAERTPPSKQKTTIENRFKNDDDPLKMVIVCDMWLTGFDVPSCHTMYIDKPLKGHNLMQAVARVNRVHGDKSGGLIVDYIGIAENLKNAMNDFSQLGKSQVFTDNHEAFREFLRYKEAASEPIKETIKGEYEQLYDDALSIAPLAVDAVLKDNETKKSFKDNVAAMSKAYSLCITLDEAKEFTREVAFLQYVKSAILKIERDAGLSNDKGSTPSVEHLLNNSIIAKDIVDIYELAGIDHPNITNISEEFINNVVNMKNKNFARELLEKLINHQIKSRSINNVVMEKKFSERLNESMNRYHNKSITSAEVLKELAEQARDINEALQRGEKLNLSNDELAFYDAVSQYKDIQDIMGDDVLVMIVKDLVESLRKSITIDWTQKDSVRAKMRTDIKRLLRKHGYPPEGYEDAIKNVMLQLEKSAENFTS